jgi:hypothetical protein
MGLVVREEGVTDGEQQIVGEGRGAAGVGRGGGGARRATDEEQWWLGGPSIGSSHNGGGPDIALSHAATNKLDHVCARQ